MDETLNIEIWDIFKAYIPDKNKEAAANQYVDYLVGRDVSIGTLESMMGYDTHLDVAIKYVLDEAKSLDDEPDFEDYADDDYSDDWED